MWLLKPLPINKNLEWDQAVVSELYSTEDKHQRHWGGMVVYLSSPTEGLEAAVLFMEWLLSLKNSQPFSLK